MTVRVAIPMPHSIDREYAERAIPQYERAVSAVGADPVRILLDQTPAQITKLIESCDALLLPGSKADIDPARFGRERSPRSGTADARREEVDQLLLDHVYAQRKPVLGICYGMQSLNVYREGSLVQHIPDFLPQETRAKVNHEAGSKVAVAHTVEIESGSVLAKVLGRDSRPRLSGRAPLDSDRRAIVPVNSSHHQSADTIGNGLRIVARCPDDGIVEALEGTTPSHFVLAVQWHPERSVEGDAASRAIFQALVDAARVF